MNYSFLSTDAIIVSEWCIFLFQVCWNGYKFCYCCWKAGYILQWYCFILFVFFVMRKNIPSLISFWKIALCSVIMLLPLFMSLKLFEQLLWNIFVMRKNVNHWFHIIKIIWTTFMKHFFEWEKISIIDFIIIKIIWTTFMKPDWIFYNSRIAVLVLYNVCW